MRSGRPRIRRQFWEPRVDLLEDDQHLIVKAEIAGVKGDEIQLIYSAEHNTLTIRGLRHEEDLQETCRTGCYQLEIYYGEFERVLELPDENGDPDGMKGHYRNGILTVRIPKR